MYECDAHATPKCAGHTLRELMFVKLNGPPWQHFSAKHFAKKWIKDGRHSASDKPSGRSSTTDIELLHHQKLFCV